MVCIRSNSVSHCSLIVRNCQICFWGVGGGYIFANADFYQLILTHFWSVLSFYTPWKNKETLWFSGAFRGYKMENTVASLNFLVWKFYEKTQFVSLLFRAIRLKLCGNYAFPRNFHTRKLGEILVFYAVSLMSVYFCKYYSLENPWHWCLFYSVSASNTLQNRFIF